MKVQAINNFNYIFPQKTKNVSQPMTRDTFTKSPAFRGYRLMPYLEGKVPYDAKNLKQFNQILSNMDNGYTEELKKRTLSLLSHHIGYHDKQDYTFGLDFLIRTANPEEIKEVNANIISKSLPKIEFAEENKPNVLALIDQMMGKWMHLDSYTYQIFNKTFYRGNIPLLKTLIIDDNWRTFLFHEISSYEFIKQQLPIIREGQKSYNPEIKELFNDKNLYNLLKRYENIYITSGDEATRMFDLGLIHLYQTPLPQRNLVAENMVHNILKTAFYNKEEYISEIPVTNQERAILKTHDGYSNIILNAFDLRVEKIIKRNGIETPEQLLNCLNDKIMSEDLLTIPYNDTTILNKITEIPVTKENQQIISQIVEKLSQMPAFPDNYLFRQAALTAAKNGNAELLRLFDLKHIHYKNILNENINNFPESVQENLKNAKINDNNLTAYVNYPAALEKYLADHPKVDINSKDNNGDTLLTTAIDALSLPMLDILAKRDDVDWNMIDKNGDNILMRVFNNSYCDANFKKSVIKILQSLDKGKFDINYVNERALEPLLLPYTVLSKNLRTTSLLKELLEFPNINTNLNPQDESPLILQVINDIDKFKLIFSHPSTDTSLLTPNFSKKLINNYVRIDTNVLEFINKQYKKQIAKEIQNLYDEKGIFDIEDFEQIIKLEDLDKIINMKFNIAGENIGHLLADYYPDSNNPQELMRITNIVETLKQKGFNFSAKDDFDRTPLDKAKEAENKIIKTLLERYI